MKYRQRASGRPPREPSDEELAAFVRVLDCIRSRSHTVILDRASKTARQHGNRAVAAFEGLRAAYLASSTIAARLHRRLAELPANASSSRRRAGLLRKARSIAKEVTESMRVIRESYREAIREISGGVLRPTRHANWVHEYSRQSIPHLAKSIGQETYLDVLGLIPHLEKITTWAGIALGIGRGARNLPYLPEAMDELARLGRAWRLLRYLEHQQGEYLARMDSRCMRIRTAQRKLIEIRKRVAQIESTAL